MHLEFLSDSVTLQDVISNVTIKKINEILIILSLYIVVNESITTTVAAIFNKFQCGYLGYKFIFKILHIIVGLNPRIFIVTLLNNYLNTAKTMNKYNYF